MTYWTDDKAAELHALIVRACHKGFSGTRLLTYNPDPPQRWRSDTQGSACAPIPTWVAAAILEAELRELAEHRQPRVVMRRAGDRYAVTWVVEWPDAKDMHVGPTLAHAIVAALEARP
jgi:hypothetical protein